jgi:hypothetical protein
MTTEFRNLKDDFPKEKGICMATADCEQVQAICLYQIADSLCEIKMVLADIKREIAKRKV